MNTFDLDNYRAGFFMGVIGVAFEVGFKNSLFQTVAASAPVTLASVLEPTSSMSLLGSFGLQALEMQHAMVGGHQNSEVLHKQDLFAVFTAFLIDLAFGSNSYVLGATVARLTK